MIEDPDEIPLDQTGRFFAGRIRQPVCGDNAHEFVREIHCGEEIPVALMHADPAIPLLNDADTVVDKVGSYHARRQRGSLGVEVDYGIQVPVAYLQSALFAHPVGYGRKQFRHHELSVCKHVPG